MKSKIIEILGKNHTTPIEFNSIEKYSNVYGLYTYKNGVYVFRDGEDLDFEELTSKEQEKILNIVESKCWKLNKSLQ